MFKIQLPYELFLKLENEMITTRYIMLDKWLKNEYNIKITNGASPKWTDEFLIFNSEEDYFLFLLEVL